jgi:pyruvate kinase
MPLYFDSTKSAPDETNKDVMETLKNSGLLNVGNQFILTYANTMEAVGATHACKAVTVV